jgi:hypothetical protein
VSLKWRDLVTERDGETPCFARLLTFISFAGYIGITVYNQMHGTPIDFVSWASGMTMITVGGAGAARVKLDTEATAS